MYNDASAGHLAARIAAAAPPESGAHGATSPLARLLVLQERASRGPARPAPGRLDRRPPDRAAGAERREQCAEARLRPGRARMARTGSTRWACAASCCPRSWHPGRRSARCSARAGREPRAWRPGCSVVAGTTDGCASFLATGADAIGDGVTALGTTLTLKLLSDRARVLAGARCLQPSPGRSLAGRRRVEQRRQGAAALLHRRADGRADAAAAARRGRPGLHWHPLPGRGERFPVADPTLELRAGATAGRRRPLVPGACWKGSPRSRRGPTALLARLGGPTLRSVRTVGGGAANPAWTAIRAALLQRADAAAGQPGAGLRHGAARAPGSDRGMKPRDTGRARCVLGRGSAAIPSRSRRPAATPRSRRTACSGSRRRACGSPTPWTRDLFVPVGSAPVLQDIDGRCRRSGHRVRWSAELNPEGLRPSIETTLHALLPHRVVVHTHSVRTIALAIRTDGEARIGRAAGRPALGLGALPQARPAADRAPSPDRLGARPVDVLVLGNHGLVVGGATRRRGRRRCWPRSSGGWTRRCEPPADARRPWPPGNDAGSGLRRRSTRAPTPWRSTRRGWPGPRPARSIRTT